MRRYTFNEDLNGMERCDADVIIIGSGVAGLYTALNLDERLSCIVLNKSGPEESNSMYAQGGIAAVVERGDDPEAHLQDTLAAGAGLCELEAARVLVSEGPADITSLIKLGVPFDLESNGRLHIAREGAHSQNRIIHCGGDATGFHLTKTLLRAASERSNIRMIDNAFLVDVLTDENGAATGVAAACGKLPCRYFAAPRIVIASGGIGRVYRNSTNASCATGDGITAAMRAGAELKDMEFVQFHPTALIHPDNRGRFFLISEALRGEGAVLRNRRWERFMIKVHPMGDLAPRDIVSRAIINEMRKSDLPHVYLDITSKPRDFLKSRFPTIYYECMRRDIDIAIDWIPVLPVQHYFMGGIKADIDSRASIPGLYACGEAACTGVHGANRLASNSLLECLVFGRRCAQHINGSVGSKPGTPKLEKAVSKRDDDMDIESFRTEIRELMTKKGGIIRNAAGLTEAIEKTGQIYDRMDATAFSDIREFETYNMASIAQRVLKAALERKESIGAHYRDDEKQEG
ncbi:MAG: L-aspartate oxidase [Bacillota bacterium]|nr:L-aspartate oxidase [Bacillota bacterium]